MSTVRVGQVGYGWFGGIHAQTWLQMPGVELVGVCDRNLERLTGSGQDDTQDSFHVEAGEAEAGLPEHVARFTDVEELLAHGVDVLDVVVDEHTHAEMVGRAIDAGVHVIVEKPLALTLEEARDLVARAEARGTHIYLGHILRFDARNETLASLVRGQELRHLSFQRNFQQVAHSVYGRVHPVFGASIHDIDLAMWYAGRRPSAVSAFTSSFFGSETPDVLDVVLHWDDGLRAVIQNSWHLSASCPYGFEFECKVQAVDGTYVLRNEPDLHAWTAEGVSSPEMHFWPVVAGERAGAIRSELTHFADCVRRGAPSDRVPLEQVLWSAEVAAAVLEAAADPAQGPVRL